MILQHHLYVYYYIPDKLNLLIQAYKVHDSTQNIYLNIHTKKKE